MSQRWLNRTLVGAPRDIGEDELTVRRSLAMDRRRRELPLNLLMKHETVGGTPESITHTSMVVLYHRNLSLSSSVTRWKNLGST